MQHFRDNEKKQLKSTFSQPFWILFLQNFSWVILVRVLTFCSICLVQLAAILDFISAKFVMGYPCVRHYILFYIHGPAILHYF